MTLMLSLLRQRRFLPFFLCQFGGAFNDNLFRLALVAMLSFGIFRGDNGPALIQLAAAVFMLPFFLFSAAAGDLTDQLPQRRLLLATKLAELAIMTLAAAALFIQSLPLLFLCLFATGIQSAFFGPAKYAFLPVLLPPTQLLNANAWFSVSTFAAILAGTVAGTAAGKSPDLALPLAAALVTIAAAGAAAAAAVPLPPQAPPPKRPAFTPIASYRTVMTCARTDATVFHCILAGSWFWLVGILLLNELPQLPYPAYKTMLAAVLAGVATGAAAIRFFYRGRLTVRHTPHTLLAGGLLLAAIAAQFTPQAPPDPALATTIALFAAVMTVYVVPLRATVQARAPLAHRAKAIAAYNIFNALFIVIAAVTAAALHAVVSDSAAASRLVLQTAAALSLAGVIPAYRFFRAPPAPPAA